MIIGIPKEIKNREYRVGATPAMVKAFRENGHRVWVETEAGAAINYTDEQYKLAGAEIKNHPQEVWEADLIIKVKEPQKKEYPFLREGQILFCYLHLAPNRELTEKLVKKKVVALAFDTLTDQLKRLPLLIPMSQIAGRMSIQVGAWALQLNQGGKGILLGGVPGVPGAQVTIIGGGVVGTEAARMALGLGAEVTILDRDPVRLRELDLLFGPSLKTLYSTQVNVEELLPRSDLVIGAVLIPGKSAPKIITRGMIKTMEKGSVFVDVAIDQGGSSETSHPTTHDDPIYEVDGVIHYCVTNMPGACAKTATVALGNATAFYALKIADLGWKAALRELPGMQNSLNVCLGEVTYKDLADELGYTFVPPSVFLENQP